MNLIEFSSSRHVDDDGINRVALKLALNITIIVQRLDSDLLIVALGGVNYSNPYPNRISDWYDDE